MGPSMHPWTRYLSLLIGWSITKVLVELYTTSLVVALYCKVFWFNVALLIGAIIQLLVVVWIIAPPVAFICIQLLPWPFCPDAEPNAIA